MSKTEFLAGTLVGRESAVCSGLSCSVAPLPSCSIGPAGQSRWQNLNRLLPVAFCRQSATAQFLDSRNRVTARSLAFINALRVHSERFRPLANQASRLSPRIVANLL